MLQDICQQNCNMIDITKKWELYYHCLVLLQFEFVASHTCCFFGVTSLIINYKNTTGHPAIIMLNNCDKN